MFQNVAATTEYRRVFCWRHATTGFPIFREVISTLRHVPVVYLHRSPVSRRSSVLTSLMTGTPAYGTAIGPGCTKRNSSVSNTPNW